MTRHLDPDELAILRDLQLEREGMRRLWTAVLCTAVADARSTRERLGTPAERRDVRTAESDAQAVQWLGSADCAWVASAAGYDPAFVDRKLREAGLIPEQGMTT